MTFLQRFLSKRFKGLLTATDTLDGYTVVSMVSRPEKQFTVRGPDAVVDDLEGFLRQGEHDVRVWLSESYPAEYDQWCAENEIRHIQSKDHPGLFGGSDANMLAAIYRKLDELVKLQKAK